MIAAIVAWCVRHSWLVIAIALVLAAGGELGRRSLSRDVLPDLSDPQIVLVADWMGHPASEVSASVTKILTSELESIPGATAVRGSSMTGMAYLDVVFRSTANLVSGRDAILARVADIRSRLPANVRVQVGPVASSTGWVFQYVLVDPTHGQSLVTLRRLQEDGLRPALAAIPGVAEVATVGGLVQQARIEVRTDELVANHLAFTDVLASLGVKGDLSDAPGQVKDVARAQVVDEMPAGVVDLDGGSRVVVGGIVVARWDANLPRSRRA